MRYLLNAILKLSTNNEGGYSNHPDDPGGPTNHGITQATLRAFRKRSVSVQDVRNLSLNEANQIYVENYWAPIWGDQLPAGLDYAMFDFGINSGVGRAVRELQKLLPGCAVDGVMGKKTLALVEAQDVTELIQKLCAARLHFCSTLRNWKTFGRGWTYRITGKDPKGQFKRRPGVVGDALAMVAQKPVSLLPFPVEDLLPLGKAREVDTKITAPLGNKIQIGGILAGAGTAVVQGLPSLVKNVSDAKDQIETIKDVSQTFTYIFAGLVVLLAVLTILHGTKIARQGGLNT